MEYGRPAGRSRNTATRRIVVDRIVVDRIVMGRAVLVLAAVASTTQVLVNHFRPGMDFVARYAAGSIAAQGVNPYDTRRLLEAEQRLWSGLEALPFFDPPPTAALFRVLAGLPMSTARACPAGTAGDFRSRGVLGRVAGATR